MKGLWWLWGGLRGSPQGCGGKRCAAPAPPALRTRGVRAHGWVSLWVPSSVPRAPHAKPPARRAAPHGARGRAQPRPRGKLRHGAAAGQGEGGSSFSGANRPCATLPSPSTPSAPLVFLSPPGIEQTPKHPLATGRGPAAPRGPPRSSFSPAGLVRCRLPAACSCPSLPIPGYWLLFHPGAICSCRGGSGAGGRPLGSCLCGQRAPPLRSAPPKHPHGTPKTKLSILENHPQRPPGPATLCPQEISPSGHGAAFDPEKYRDQQHHLRFVPHLLGHGERGPGEGHPLLHRPQQEGEQELQQVQAPGEPGRGEMWDPPSQGEEKGFWGENGITAIPMLI